MTLEKLKARADLLKVMQALCDCGNDGTLEDISSKTDIDAKGSVPNSLEELLAVKIIKKMEGIFGEKYRFTNPIFKSLPSAIARSAV